MIIQYEMNKPKTFKKDYFDAVLACGYRHNRWLEIALKYLPEELFDNTSKGFLFTSTVTRDACRVARHFCQTREIILISERILPSQNVSDETNPKARYFIYTVLHEIAHAVKAHSSPFLDNLTNEEGEAQEKEADDLAVKWFNEHVTKRNNRHLLPITEEEIKKAQEINKIIMKKLKNDI